MCWRVILFLAVVQVLQEVEHRQVASFVPHADLGAFSILVTSDNISLEEVIPGVRSLKCLGVEEFYLLLFNGEKEVFTRFDQNHVNVVV